MQSMIPAIQNDKGDIDINAKFNTFYQDLYKSDNPDNQNISSFLFDVRFSDLLALRLLTVFKDAVERGSFPSSMQTALIT